MLPSCFPSFNKEFIIIIIIYNFALALQKKFECDPFKGLLLKTGTCELVHIPMRGKTDYWTGRVDKESGNINGENTMGKLLMEVRQEMQEAEKGAQNEENIEAIEDESESKLVDENKGGDDIDDEIKGDDDSKDEIKRDDDSKVDDQKSDDETTTSEPKDISGSKRAKRKREDNVIQVENPDEEVAEGPKIKRKKIEEESKDVLETKGDDENKDGDQNKDDDKKSGIEHKGDGEATSHEAMDGSGYKGKKRKLVDNDAQVECLDEKVSERPKIKRKKTGEKSKGDIENKTEDENKSDGEETGTKG